MTKIPTAEEFLQDIKYVTYSHEEKMIEFAKLHVKAALEAAAKKAETEERHGWMFVNKDSILNAYPEKLIK